MEANDNAGCLTERAVWTFFASKLAPTGLPVCQVINACATTR
jgi:hypothetical protein